jgi:SAM-dependent methyltransferase
MSDDPRLVAPSAARNRGPILEALAPHLPQAGLALEIASGTGEHVAHFAASLPHLTWQPTDPVPERRASIDAYADGLANIRPAIDLDTTSDPWPVAYADAVLCINMIHIAPWSAALGLVTGAARILPPGGLLALYGPYRQRGQPLLPGNVAFDADLRARDPEWGLREVETLAEIATGFHAPTLIAMPADNLLVVFRRRT